ncbi:hypothetical protein AMAG_08656 [Allomyces macrogynus ATCC 38327]|uniref:Uncharacterized protein n=1 Tax=Allomyces macrogynus (strain ATCC 38327) TaxID=578462 RepID=A0A0L0SME4_ALLM3|nr:hypothetical protein AMAG_08656 [Allomyces macrogynus ATCC 38327]|eukprot:KNE63545.1 hypothetical protein AMAG_08656 [Allomyces macrogynus ATCC 38327]
MSAPSAAPATPAGTVDRPHEPTGSPHSLDRQGRFSRMVNELGKKLSRRADRQDLIQRNIMKVDPAKPGLSRVPSAPGPVTAGALAPPAVIPRSISNDPARPPATAAPADLTLPPPLTVQAQGEIDTDSILTPKKEQDLERLAARIGRRPSKVELQERNIFRGESDESVDSTTGGGHAASAPATVRTSFTERSTMLKGCLKKRPERTELVEKNILHSDTSYPNVDASLSPVAETLKRAQLSDMLNSQLATRPLPSELPPRLIKFDETVEVLPTFRKTEYNRKPDANATFRRLTPRMKMEIRDELNDFKKNEMPVHEKSLQNTAFH